MQEKKGLNFLVGIGVLVVIYKIYTLGIFHQFGFMAVNYATGSNIDFNPMATRGTLSDTPVASFASLMVDLVTILGYLATIVMSGIWDALIVVGKYTKDLFDVLRVYLQNYTKTKTEPVTPVEKTDVSVESNKIPVEVPMVQEKPALQIILETLKELRDRQAILEEKINKETT